MNAELTNEMYGGSACVRSMPVGVGCWYVCCINMQKLLKKGSGPEDYTRKCTQHTQQHVCCHCSLCSPCVSMVKWIYRMEIKKKLTFYSFCARIIILVCCSFFHPLDPRVSRFLILNFRNDFWLLLQCKCRYSTDIDICGDYYTVR